ncbi:MAG: hypothetical protein U0228_38155 [Myxococcaceae bacterium]
MKRTLQVAAVFLLVSCTVESTRPLTAASAAKADPALPGTWVSTDKDHLKFVVTAREATVRIVVSGGDRDPMTLEGYVSVLAPDLKVLNLRAIEDGKPSPTWLFVRYAVNANGTIDTWLINENLASDALNKGTLKGHRGQYGGVTLEDTPEKVIAFLTKGRREDTFSPLMTLTRSKAAP